jgi:hypothetical protein
MKARPKECYSNTHKIERGKKSKIKNKAKNRGDVLLPHL